ncbi:MAG: hypothetical protein IKK34_07395 [Clostridia bacterium]|nr:hypothetical protein [Clostridia bacterium]
MRLGIVMMGTGVHAAAAIGVLDALFAREIEPHAVCGLLGGAWPAALYASGMGQEDMHAALVQAGSLGRGLFAHGASARMLARGRERAIFDAKRIERLLVLQSGQRMLSLCPRAAVFPCRTLRSGYPIVFSTRAYRQESGLMLSMQVSLSFAARAALAPPPLLPAMRWMGYDILPLADEALACRQLLAMGAQRVLIIAPQLSPRTEPDALDLAAAGMSRGTDAQAPPHAAVLRVQMEDGITALAAEKLPACAQCGRRAAERELDGCLSRMGMAYCRVLPFRRERA